MIESVILDSGPLGKLAHPNPSDQTQLRLAALKRAYKHVIIVEIVDYELRRNFLLHGFTQSIAALDQLTLALPYMPLNTQSLRLAASMWADVRRRGRPMAGDRAIDLDVILAAQAKLANAAVATSNATHIRQLAVVVDWDAIPTA